MTEKPWNYGKKALVNRSGLYGVPTLVRCVCGVSLPKGAMARKDRETGRWYDCYLCRKAAERNAAEAAIKYGTKTKGDAP
tara:strand:+ start:1540 stop:1779 length:240 start_codon:yes stop_codon:yes gene_type:complete